MKISVQFHGILADRVGRRSAGFKLADGATYGDLLQEINRRYRANMPLQLWDAGKNMFQ